MILNIIWKIKIVKKNKLKDILNLSWSGASLLITITCSRRV